MSALIAMLIICWMPQKDGTLKEIWRIEQTVSVEHCLQMSEAFSGGGRAAAITVRCGPSRVARDSGEG